MGDFFVAILTLLNVIHLENKVIVSCLFEKDKAVSFCNSMDEAFDCVAEEFNNKCHSGHTDDRE